MANPETVIQEQIRPALGRRPTTRIFRNNVGSYKLPTGGRVIYGLAEGSGDLIGWERVRVTPEMVGSDVAVFLSCEVKTETGRPQPNQINWMNAVNAHGGIAFIARSVEEAQQELDSRVQMMQRGVTVH